jgi:hypothetical protein
VEVEGSFRLPSSTMLAFNRSAITFSDTVRSRNREEDPRAITRKTAIFVKPLMSSSASPSLK